MKVIWEDLNAEKVDLEAAAEQVAGITTVAAVVVATVIIPDTMVLLKKLVPILVMLVMLLQSMEKVIQVPDSLAMEF